MNVTAAVGQKLVTVLSVDPSDRLRLAERVASTQGNPFDNSDSNAMNALRNFGRKFQEYNLKMANNYFSGSS